MTRVKTCGITSVEDALLAVEAGVHAIGLVFADSPRRVSLATAEQIAAVLPPFVSTVGVFSDANSVEVVELAERVPLTALQLHGNESPEYCELFPWQVIKRFDIRENDTPETLRQRIQRYRVAAHLLDPGAGGDRVFDWEVARGLPSPLIVSGGLNPDNVGDAIRLLRPFAVDVCSAVESEPGRKDAERLGAFVRAVREADADDRTA